MKKIIAIDPSSVKIGVAILEYDFFSYDVVFCDKIVLPKKLTHWQGRLSEARRRLLGMLSNHKHIDTAIIEVPPTMMKRSMATLRILHAYMSVCAEACYSHGIRNIILRDPNVTRKILEVKKGCEKSILAKEILNYFPEQKKTLSFSKDNDVIDAIGLGYSFILDPVYEIRNEKTKKEQKKKKKERNNDDR